MPNIGFQPPLPRPVAECDSTTGGLSQMLSREKPPADDEAADAAGRTVLVTSCGENVVVNDLPVPTGVKRVLKELDLDKQGQITEEELNQSLNLIKSLKAGMDTDGSGSVSNDELMAGVQLVTKLKESQTKNAPEMEYSYLPQKIQEVMREWDVDGSGKVNASELAAAADAFKKIQQEGRMMKKIIVVMAVVILLLMVGMFVLSYLAAEMAKEMRAQDSGVMQTSNGDVVKVSSSDFEVLPDGSLVLRGSDLQSNVTATCPNDRPGCRRLQEGGSGALKVASQKVTAQLSSTLPNSAFEELESLTLKDNKNGSLKVVITSFQRVQLRSSRCGSVVHLYCQNGRLTLDDFLISADEAMQKYAEQAGMKSLFDGEELSGFGRRLSSTDGMLEGFFNLLENVDWQCESQPLEAPEAIPQYYHAVTFMKHLHENPGSATSLHFTGDDGFALDMPGVVFENGRPIKTWDEELVIAGTVTAIKSTFEMFPLNTQLRVKQAGKQLTMTVEGSTGYRCRIEDTKEPAINAVSGTPELSLEFKGVIDEQGTIVRHFRMRLDSEVKRRRQLRRLQAGSDSNSTDNSPSKTEAMMAAGLLPNIIDYYDVDTDKTGRLAAGAPFRIEMRSDVPGGKSYDMTQYTSVTPLPAAMTMKGAMDYLGVTELDTACVVSNETARGANLTAVLSAIGEVPVANPAGLIDRNTPPEIKPWAESSAALSYSYTRLVPLYTTNPDDPRLLKALRSQYWSSILLHRRNFDVLIAMRTVPARTGSGGGRRLGEWRNGSRPGEYSVRLSSKDRLRAAPPPRPGRPDRHERSSLLTHFGGANGVRRLDDDVADYSFEFWITPERMKLGVDMGDSSTEVEVHYCHWDRADLTDWPACKTGRSQSGEIVKVLATAVGSQEVWSWPEITVSQGGQIVYDATGDSGTTAYGVLIYSCEVDIILGIGFGFTIEIGVGTSNHDTFGVYVSEVYGKLLIEIDDTNAYMYFKLASEDPWIYDYKMWQFSISFGYEIDTWWKVYRDDYEVVSTDLDFRNW